MTFETLRKTDPLDHQRIMQIINTFVRECGAYPAETLALMIRGGFQLTTKTLAQAFEINAEEDKREQALAEKRRKEAEQACIEAKRLDVIFHIDWNRRNGDPGSLYKLVQTCDLNEAKKYLKELQERPTHYRSLFKDGKILEATQFLFEQIAIREYKTATNPTKPPRPDPPIATAKAYTT